MPLVILLAADEPKGIGQARIFSKSQPDQRLDNLQDIGNVKNRETEFPPIWAGFGGGSGRISGGGRVNA